MDGYPSSRPQELSRIPISSSSIFIRQNKTDESDFQVIILSEIYNQMFLRLIPRTGILSFLSAEKNVVWL